MSKYMIKEEYELSPVMRIPRLRLEFPIGRTSILSSILRRGAGVGLGHQQCFMAPPTWRGEEAVAGEW